MNEASAYGNHPYRIGLTTNSTVASGPDVAATSTFTVEVAFKVPQAEGGERLANIVRLGTLTTSVGVDMEVSSAPSLEEPQVNFRLDYGPSTVGVSLLGDYADDQWHLASMVVTNSGKTITAYMDGVLAGSDTAPSSPAGDLTAFRVLYNGALQPGDPVAAGYVAFTPAALTADQIAAHAEIASGSAGFRTDEVVQRYAEIANVPFSALDQGASRVPTFGGPDAASVVADAMNTERGRLYVDGSGTLTFESRDYFLTKVYANDPDISGAASMLTPDAYFPLDPQELINRAEVTRAGGATIVREDAASILVNGVYGDPQTIQAMTDADAANLAAYLLWLYLDPGARLAGARVNLYAQSATVQQYFLINLMGAWLHLTGLPTQSPTGTTADQYIEGFTETITGSEWSLSVNTTAKLEDTDTWWRLNDANFPLGTNTHPFY